MYPYATAGIWRLSHENLHTKAFALKHEFQRMVLFYSFVQFFESLLFYKSIEQIWRNSHSGFSNIYQQYLQADHIKRWLGKQGARSQLKSMRKKLLVIWRMQSRLRNRTISEQSMPTSCSCFLPRIENSCGWNQALMMSKG